MNVVAWETCSVRADIPSLQSLRPPCSDRERLLQRRDGHPPSKWPFPSPLMGTVLTRSVQGSTSKSCPRQRTPASPATSTNTRHSCRQYPFPVAPHSPPRPFHSFRITRCGRSRHTLLQGHLPAHPTETLDRDSQSIRTQKVARKL
jgi:hypothetical protein